MQDKKILAILSSDSNDEVINTFITSFAKGKNIDVTLCTVSESHEDVHDCDALVDSVTLTCTRQSIPLRITEIHRNAATAMRKRAPFVDLVLLDKDILRGLALRDELPHNTSAIIALPQEFNSMSNVILLFDGSSASLRGIKEFFQAFSRYTAVMDVTLLSLIPEDAPVERDNEVMLLEYLRQYSNNVGLLKVQTPLSDRHLRAVPHSQSPMVIGTLEFLMAQRGKNITFKPFYDNHSTLFIPASNS
jgi:hypothetical protein